MKKYLSLVLALALVLTTLAVPMSVSAAGETVTVSLSADKDAAYPGDEVTVTVNASADTEFTAAYAQIAVKYNKNVFEVVETSNANAADYPTYGFVRYINDSSYSIGTEAAEVFTITFKVKTSVVEAMQDVAFTIREGDDASFADGNWDIPTVVVENTTVDIETATYSAQIYDNGEWKDIPSTLTTYYDSNSVTVKYTATGNVTAALYKGEDMVAELTSGVEQVITAADNGAGTYTIRLTLANGETKDYTFAYVAEDIAAKLTTVAPTDVADGVVAGDSVVIPVKISGLSSAVAENVTFNVEYDAGVLTLDTTGDALVSYTDAEAAPSIEGNTVKTVAYGTGETKGTATGDDYNIVDLTFTVADAAAWGTTAVTISAAQMALKTEIVDPTPGEVAITTASQYVTVIPDAAFATVSYEPTTWVAEAYAVTVARAVGADVYPKVYYYENASAELLDPSAMQGTEITDALTFNVEDEEMTYYVYAVVGEGDFAVYSLIATLAPGAGNWLDTTGPSLVADAVADLDMAEWVDTKESGDTISLDAATLATSTGSPVVGFVYSFDGTEYTVTADDEVAIEAGASYEQLYIKAVDGLGKQSDASAKITLKYDGVDPEVTITVGNFEADGVTKTVTIAPSDDTGVASVTVYKSQTSDLEDFSALTPETATSAGSNYTVTTTESAYFYAVVVDNAGHKVVAEQYADLGKIAAVDIKVATVKNAELAAGFKAVEELAGYESTSNGTFTYIKIQEDATEEGKTTEVELTKGGAVVEKVAEQNYYELDATADGSVAGDYVLTVTTTSDDDELNTSTDTYNFTIVATQAAMKSVDTNASYGAYDWAKIKKLIDGQTEAVAPAAGSGFTGGLYSADVNGSLGYTTDDIDAILAALRAGQFSGIYTFDIMNGIVTENAEF